MPHKAPATEHEAKRHWREAKKLLVREAQEAFRRGEEWTTSANGYPIVVSADGEWAMGFGKQGGAVFMFDVFAYHPHARYPAWMLHGDERPRSSTLGVVRPSFRRIRIGPLSFEFIRRQGATEEVRVRADGSRDILAIRYAKPSEKVPEETAAQLMSDLKVMANDPARVLEITDEIGMDADNRLIIESMIDWAKDHRRQVERAFFILQPGASPWRLLKGRP